jgi:hypothetical protein
MNKQVVPYKLSKSHDGTCLPKNVSVVVYDTVSISKRYINERQNDRWTRVDMEGSGRCLIKLLCWYLICGTEESREIAPSQDSHWPNRDSNWALPEYKSGSLPLHQSALWKHLSGSKIKWERFKCDLLTKYVPNTSTYWRKNNQGSMIKTVERISEYVNCSVGIVVYTEHKF